MLQVRIYFVNLQTLTIKLLKLDKMEDLSDILDDMSNLDFNESEQNKLESKFRNRTQTDINEPFYNRSGWGINISQLLSIVLGFGACLSAADKFPTIAPIIFIGCIFLLIINEVGKRMALGKVDEIRIINKNKSVQLKSKPYQVAALFFFCCSVGSGFIGGPRVIEYYSSHSPLAALDSVRANFVQQIEETKEEFNLSSSNAFAMADKLHAESNWKGTTSKSVRTEKAALIVMGSKIDSIKTAVIDRLNQEMNNEVLRSEIENKDIIKEHKVWCQTFGWWAIGIVLFLDVLLVVLCRWRYDHMHRRLTENRNKQKLVKDKDHQGQRLDTTVKESFRVKDDVKEVEKQAVSNIGFNNQDKDFNRKEGDVLKGIAPKVDRVFVLKDNGELKAYTVGGLNNLIKGSGKARSEHLETLKLKLIRL